MKFGDKDRFNGKCSCGTKFSAYVVTKPDPSNKRLGFLFSVVEGPDAGRDYAPATDGSYRLIWTCKCGPRLARPVLGKYVPEKTCNPKCLAATGHQCECSCGGKRHGAGHEG